MKLNDELGDRLKELEGAEAKRRIEKGQYLLARLDGRAFHTFTKGLTRPYDDRLSSLMVDVTKALVHELNARVGYTQSDEISLVWHYDASSESDYPFGGRIQKLCSVLAACATGNFVQRLPAYIPEKSTQIPLFDCRVWGVEEGADAVNTFVWRERDAKKNAVSMAASAYISHKELQGVHSNDRIKMMADLGIDFEAMPRFFKYGTYVLRKTVNRCMTDEELIKVPEKHRDTAAAAIVARTSLEEAPFTSLLELPDPVGFLQGKVEVPA